MNDEEYKKKVALPDDYVEQESCGNCEFRETEFGDRSCGDPDTYFCDFGQDYHIEDTWWPKRYEWWREVREIKRCGICSKYKREKD